MKEHQQIIKKFISTIRESLSAEDYEQWVSPLGVHVKSSGENVTIVLVPPNRFVFRWVRQNFLHAFQAAAESIADKDKPIQIDLVKEDENSSKTISERIDTNNILQYSDNRSLKRELVFDSFVEGSSNQFALATAMEVANLGKTSGNPLVFYSPSGLGKSHLTQAIANYCLYVTKKKKVAYVRSEKYFREMVISIKNKNEAFKDFYRNLDILIIDDIHFFAGKDRTQDEFFHTFNTLLDRGGQMVFTSDRYPKVINGLEDRIKSRVGMGLAVAIEPPELETRIVILQKKAKKQGFDLSEECSYFIAEKIKSNVRELEGALRLVVAKANFMGSQKITTALVKEALLDILAQVERNMTTDIIQKAVSDYYRIKISDLLSSSKSRSIVRPRQVAMTLSKDLTNKSLPEIGKDFGGRDHTTVIHAINKVKELISKDQQLNQDYKNLERILLA